MIEHEADPAALYAFLEIMASSAGNRPRKGEREGHPTTEIVVAAGSRLAQIGAVPYREYRRQQSLRRALFNAASGRNDAARKQRAEATAPHLSFF